MTRSSLTSEEGGGWPFAATGRMLAAEKKEVIYTVGWLNRSYERDSSRDVHLSMQILHAVCTHMPRCRSGFREPSGRKLRVGRPSRLASASKALAAASSESKWPMCFLRPSIEMLTAHLTPLQYTPVTCASVSDTRSYQGRHFFIVTGVMSRTPVVFIIHTSVLGRLRLHCSWRLPWLGP